MSINFCSINGFTINAQCSGARQRIVQHLLDLVHPVEPPVTSGVGAVGYPQHWTLPNRDDYVVEPQNVESLDVRIEVSFGSMAGAITFENSPSELTTAFVTINNIQTTVDLDNANVSLTNLTLEK